VLYSSPEHRKSRSLKSMTSETALLNLPVPDATEAVLTVSLRLEDHAFLRDILSRFNWRAVGMRSRKDVLSHLQRHAAAVLISETDLSDGTWRDVLADLESLPNPPRVIVTSDLADEGLWAEALNFGAYDVLAKPFRAPEILRIISSAWRHWKR